MARLTWNQKSEIRAYLAENKDRLLHTTFVQIADLCTLRFGYCISDDNINGINKLEDGVTKQTLGLQGGRSRVVKPPVIVDTGLEERVKQLEGRMASLEKMLELHNPLVVKKQTKMEVNAGANAG